MYLGLSIFRGSRKAVYYTRVRGRAAGAYVRNAFPCRRHEYIFRLEIQYLNCRQRGSRLQPQRNTY